MWEFPVVCHILQSNLQIEITLLHSMFTNISKPNIQTKANYIYMSDNSDDSFIYMSYRKSLTQICPSLADYYSSAYYISASRFTELVESSASFPCVHLFSISKAALGWSMGTMWPASWTCDTKALDKVTLSSTTIAKNRHQNNWRRSGSPPYSKKRRNREAIE